MQIKILILSLLKIQSKQDQKLQFSEPHALLFSIIGKLQTYFYKNQKVLIR